jgi:outer membrane protein OmpA-like peptidoglycan-associated protein
MRPVWLPVAATLATLFAAPAHADPCIPRAGISTCVEADNLWPHAGGGPFFAVGSTRTTPASALSFGLVGSYLRQPVGLGVASADPAGSTVFLVDHRVDATLLFALGVTDRLELTLAAPTTLYQGGAGVAGVMTGGAALPRSGVHDLRFGLSLALLARAPGVSGPALTARLEFGAPLGSKDAFAGASSAVAAPSLVFDWRAGRVLIAAEASARVRREAVIGDAVLGTQLGAALGVAVDVVRDGWLTVSAEGFALPALAKQGADPRTGEVHALAPAEWIGSVSNTRLLGGDVVIALGAGGPLPFTPHALTAPAYRLDFSLRYAPSAKPKESPPPPPPEAAAPAPRVEPPEPVKAVKADEPDRDGDKIPDALDRCPDEPEDIDGFQDDDGCPDPDNDGDGVPDAQDRCPNEPETIDGVDDDDGCPEPGARSLVSWDGDRVVVEKPARFAPGQAELGPELLRQAKMMAQLARGRAPLASVIVETYADKPGDTSIRGAELAQARAEAVKKVFLAAGIPAEVLMAVGGDPSAARPKGASAFDVSARRKVQGARSRSKSGENSPR